MSRNPNMGLSGNSSPNTIDDRWGVIQESLDQVDVAGIQRISDSARRMADRLTIQHEEEVADKEALNIINTNKDFDKSLDRAMDEQSGYAKELFGQMIKEGVPEEEARKKIKEYFVINEAIWHQSRIDRHGKVLDYHERQNTKFNVAREVFERDNAQMLRNYGDAKRLVDGINSGGTSLRDMSPADRYRYENALREIQSIESEINGIYSGYDLKVAKSALDRANIVIDDSANIDSLDGRRVNSVDSGDSTKAEEKIEYTNIQKDGLSKLAKLRLEFMANGQDMDFAKAKEFYDRYHEIAYNSKLSNDEGTIEGFAPFMAKYKELSPTAKEAGFEEVEDEKPAPSPEANKSVETEKTKEKPVSRWRKIGKWVAGLGVGLALFGVFGNKKSEEVKPADSSPRVENVAKTNTLEDGKSTENGAFNTDNATETQKSPEAREKLADNGQYDRAADPYFAHHKSVENMFDNNEVKESLESYGPDMANLTPEEFKAKFLSEDNPAGIQQILMTNQEVAGAFGLDYQSSEALFDAYRNGDQAAFAKVAEIRKAIAEHFTQEGVGSLEGVQFDSVYLQDINGDGSDLNFAHADNLNIGGTTRIVSFIINGNKYTIETRDQCGGQIVLRDGTLIKLPPEITRIDGPTPPNTPPNEERETPPSGEVKTPPNNNKTPPNENKNTPQDSTEKDRTLEDEKTYDNITVMGSGELTQGTTEEEEDDSIDPNTQTGQNVPGVTANGADGTETSNNLRIDVQYDGEITKEGIEQMLKNQYEAIIQQQQSQQAHEDRRNSTIDIEGGEDLNLDEVIRIQEQNQ